MSTFVCLRAVGGLGTAASVSASAFGVISAPREPGKQPGGNDEIQPSWPPGGLSNQCPPPRPQRALPALVALHLREQHVLEVSRRDRALLHEEEGEPLPPLRAGRDLVGPRPQVEDRRLAQPVGD